MDYTVITDGLRFPEGPVAMPDGSVLLVEIAGGTLLRVMPDGEKRLVANTGGGPNGAAIGPDGLVYICNNGGHVWHWDEKGVPHAGGPSPDYTGGRIETVNLNTGEVKTLYDRVGANKLTAPNDIVFDRTGGFWFTDLGKGRGRVMDRGGIYYGRADGSEIREVVFPVLRPNGICLSPAEDRVYIAETDTARVWAFDIVEPGVIRKGYGTPYGGECLVTLPGYRMFDSMAVDGEGNICVATRVQGAISIISPDGRNVREIPLPDPHTTNICFGGPDLRTAYVTLADLGQLIAFPWHCPGLPLNFLNT